MKTTDWDFDFSTLPHWDRRDFVPFVYDEFLEIPQNDILCCIYSIAEVSMLNYLGCLAILQNKRKPEILLTVTEKFCFCDNISVDESGNLIFLQPSIYYSDINLVKRPILIIDLHEKRFSYFLTNNTNPCYRILESSKTVFRIEADELARENNKYLRILCRKKIRLNRLKWYSISEIDSLPEMLCDNFIT